MRMMSLDEGVWILRACLFAAPERSLRIPLQFLPRGVPRCSPGTPHRTPTSARLPSELRPHSSLSFPPHLSHDFRRAVEEIKLRAPIEDVVREYVPTLTKRGALWKACCPFHSEKTPSFTVSPSRGTWHCFGACSTGGDQISFVQEVTGLPFMEALEILADRTGVELPKSGGGAKERGPDPAFDVLRRAASFYQEVLAGPEGAAARAYLAERGLTQQTLTDFGVGFSPASGQAFVDLARAERLPWELLDRSGLARKNDRGGAYDFFRGRLMIPIRDAEGRTVGFGARRIGDDSGGPKYINTAETPLFKKSQLIYGLDLALREARREKHLILVEGYTDVMAAHQVGLARVGAVLGTATTEDHARLVRRAGARRVSLVFDGDEAGSQAARRALRGLLHLEVDLQVVTLPPGQDPCDLLIHGGAEAFLRQVEAGRDWFAHELAGLEGLVGVSLSQEVDELLSLLTCLKRPVHRQSLIGELANHLGISVEALREQWATSEAGRRQRSAAARENDLRGSERGPAAGRREAEPSERTPAPEAPAPPRPVDPRIVRAYGEILGSILLDSSLVPLARPWVEYCEEVHLRRLLELVLEMYEDVEAEITSGTLLTALGEDPARDRVVPLVDSAANAASPKALLDGALDYLNTRRVERRIRDLKRRVAELEQNLSGAPEETDGRAAEDDLRKVLAELGALLKSQKSPNEPEGSRATPTVH